MKNIIIKNSIVFLSLLVLLIPLNLFIRYYSILLSPISYLGTVIYSLLCGASLIFMDLSNKRINAVFSGLFLLCIIISLRFYNLFAYGPTVLIYILMFGTLLTSVFKNKK
jgi:hypothetical protein